MRTKLSIVLALLGLSASACTESPSQAELGQRDFSLVSVSADDVNSLADSATFTVDLTKRDVVYEIDGASAELDLDRLAVHTPASASMPMRDFLASSGTHIDESDFFLRLANDTKLLLEASSLGTQSQALNNSSGGGRIGGGGLNEVLCLPGFCICTTYDDCIDMFGGDICGPVGGCDDTHGTNCWCVPNRVQAPTGSTSPVKVGGVRDRAAEKAELSQDP